MLKCTQETHNEQERRRGQRAEQGISHLGFYGRKRHFTQKVPKSNFVDCSSKCFGFSTPKIGGVLMKTFSKGSFTRFFKQMAPPGGGVLPDSIRRGTNYLHTTLFKRYLKSHFLHLWSILVGLSAPKKREVLMKTFSKGSFTRFFQNKMAPGGGAFYKISPDVALTTCIQLHSKSTQKAILWTFKACVLWIQRSQIRRGPHENIFKRLIYPFFPNNALPRGGGGGILPDFTRRGTNYLHTTLLKNYPKSNFLDTKSTFFWFKRPQNRGGPHENIFKRLIYPFFTNNGPRGGGAFYQISPDVALTTCMQRLLELTPAICPLGPIPTVF